MYFVTIKRAGYCMFCTTQREAAAVALTEDQQRVHLLERTSDGYVMRREVPVAEQSHTAIMLRLGRVYQGLMVDMQISNDKLLLRAQAMVASIAGCPEAAAVKALERTDRNIKAAILVADRKSVV